MPTSRTGAMNAAFVSVTTVLATIVPELKWTQSSFMQPQMMVEDRYFYDPVAHKYTVDRYLDDLDKRYGGIDAVLIWPTYPNMGIDNRNQHDMVRAMPGGVAGVRQMIADFHRRGVRVLFPMMMWDQGTRDPGTSWPDAIASLMAEIGADGINGDTQDGVPLAFSIAADKIGHPLAFEPEGGPADEALAWNILTWGQYQYPFVPMVDKYKWLEPRHMVNISDRWKRDKTDNLQFAFFNGVGWESWENIWGIWNGITPRDAEATRRVATHRARRGSVSGECGMGTFRAHASLRRLRQPLAVRRQTVFTIVNRNEYDVSGPQMALAAEDGMRYFDLYHGVELKPEPGENGQIVLSFDLEAHGYGAILASKSAPDAGIQTLMSKMAKMTAQPLSVLPQRELPATADGRNCPNCRPPPLREMVKIPEEFSFPVQDIEIEGFNDIGVDVQYPWENSARRFHERPMRDQVFLDR